MPSRKRKQFKSRDIYGIAKTFPRDGKAGFNSISIHEMADAELWAIGIITVQWAYLEHMILFETARLSSKAKTKPPTEAGSLQFSRRVAAWHAVIDQTIKDPTDRKRLFKLHSKVSRLSDWRHKVTHALWEWFPADPERLRAYSFRPGVAFQEDAFKFERLLRVAEQIGEVNHELTYPPRKGLRKIDFPSGSYAYVSRRLLLEMSGKGDLNFGRVVTASPELPPQQSSSRESPPTS